MKPKGFEDGFAGYGKQQDYYNQISGNPEAKFWEEFRKNHKKGVIRHGSRPRENPQEIPRGRM